ncbi:MAG: hypothetical protein AAFN59_02380 [Pseudomonadota bacterium]
MNRMIPMITALAMALPVPALSQSPAVEVKFAAGASGTALTEQTVTGAAYVDYRLVAGAGQKMFVSLISNPSVYFNILPPANTGEAIYIGSVNGANAQISLPVDGPYVIRVYQMGNARDTGKTSVFNLSITILG